MARWHVLRDRRVLVIAAHPQVHGDTFASIKNLDAADGQARLDLRSGEAIGHGVIMRVDLDVIIDADAVQTPFAIFVRLDWKRLQRRAVDLDAPSTATNICPVRTSPVSLSTTTGTPSPA